MRIAIASDDGNTIASHFGRTRGFVIFDVDRSSGEIKGKKYLRNTFTGHAVGRHSPDRGHGSILEALKGCKVVIAGGMGRRAYDDLRGAGLEVFITRESSVEGAVSSYLKGELDSDPERTCAHP